MSGADPHVERLARLFREHPAWRAAAGLVSDEATSRVLFTHRPGERWHLVRSGGESLLLPGDAPDPDLVFRFSPAAIDRLACAEGSIGAFAALLFELIVGGPSSTGARRSSTGAPAPLARVDLRIAAPFTRLARRGYVRLLVAAGWRVLAFGARHGVRSLGQLQRLVQQLSSRAPEAWEQEGGGGGDGGLRPSAR